MKFLKEENIFPDDDGFLNEIHGFNKDGVNVYGGKYKVEEKWFSLEYWERRGGFLKRYQRRMLKEIQ